MDRHIKTLDILTDNEHSRLMEKSVCVIGAGGLGGYVIELLARLGVRLIRVADMDVFEASNLNRQLYSSEHNLSKSKVEEARKRVLAINSQVEFQAVHDEFNENNAEKILEDIDIVVDCVDNLKARYIMQDVCTKLNIPLIHGAVGSWQGQVSTVLPGDYTISKIYGDKYTEEIGSLGTGSFLPAMIASYQVAECIKVLLNKGEVLQNKVMYFDVLNNQSFVVGLDKE